jgi:hypothetical protein
MWLGQTSPALTLTALSSNSAESSITATRGWTWEPPLLPSQAGTANRSEVARPASSDPSWLRESWEKHVTPLEQGEEYTFDQPTSINTPGVRDQDVQLASIGGSTWAASSLSAGVTEADHLRKMASSSVEKSFFESIWDSEAVLSVGSSDRG